MCEGAYSIDQLLLHLASAVSEVRVRKGMIGCDDFPGRPPICPVIANAFSVAVKVAFRCKIFQ